MEDVLPKITNLVLVKIEEEGFSKKHLLEPSISKTLTLRLAP